MTPRLTVLAGPTAVGKGTVAAYIREHHPEVWLSVSATTRPARPGEVDGTHYHFVTGEEFADMVTKACHAELNCTISTISISSNDSEKAWLRNAPVSAISSFSPAKETSTSCTSGAAAREA